MKHFKIRVAVKKIKMKEFAVKKIKTKMANITTKTENMW